MSVKKGAPFKTRQRFRSNVRYDFENSFRASKGV